MGTINHNSLYKIGQEIVRDYGNRDQVWRVVAVSDLVNPITGNVVDHFIQADNVKSTGETGNLHLSFNEINFISTAKVNRW